MRLIDADELRKQAIEKLHITNSFKDITDLIDQAPTIEPSGDLISREDLISDLEEWKKNPNNDDSSVDMVNHFIGIIKAEPSAEQVTGKLKNPCDSLFTDDSADAKEHKSKLDIKDAIYFLQGISDCCSLSPEAEDSIDMAIEALSAEYEDYEHATLVNIKEPLKSDLIKCKDCKHFKKFPLVNEKCRCDLAEWWCDESDYCSKAKPTLKNLTKPNKT